MGRHWKAEALLTGSWRGATSVLLSDGELHLVVDTGMPHEASLLINALHARGIKPEDIKIVINTHFHIDHVLNNLIFINSLIYGSQESYDWCCSLYSDLGDNRRWEKSMIKYYPEIPQQQEARNRVHQMRKFTLRWWDRKRLGSPCQHRWIESHALPSGLDTFFTSGHVPGHVSIMIPNGARPTVIAGDAYLARANTERVLTMIPHNREQSKRDEEQILARGGRIFPGHDLEFTIPLSDG